ncbi:hypothetical protein CAMGR0001_1340 [Campylobacter gracilis RM3268]|uniref:Uncharacterized protein n=1 Tax=Campylobacter gracilis RM3268 TaxID=553220 RepID=C8PJE1_9BACT|nr:hypothetical protein CAMGR0001_1340 [Campylobacter gracilis RM3268]
MRRNSTEFYRGLTPQNLKPSRLNAAKFQAAEFAVNLAVCKILRRRNFIAAAFLNLYHGEIPS